MCDVALRAHTTQGEAIGQNLAHSASQITNSLWGDAVDFGVLLWEGFRFLLAAALIAGLGFTPVLWLFRRHLTLLNDPSNLLSHGVVVRRFEALDGVAEIIGRYRDSDIYRSVTFKGMRYDFERVVPMPTVFQVGPKELFIEPGILYVAHV